MSDPPKSIESEIWYNANADTDLRSFCVAESGSLDLNPSIAILGLVADLTANVLSLSITIGPDKQCLAVSGLISNIFCNW